MSAAYMFDRDARPIDAREWTRLMEDRDYRLIGQDDIAGVYVSTAWVGLPYLLDDDRLIFETMTFSDRRQDWDARVAGRYPSAPRALVGHLWTCAAVRSENQLSKGESP